MKLFLWKKFISLFCLFLIVAVLPSAALAIAVDDNFWRIDEYVDSTYYEPFNIVYFQIENEHETLSMIGFGVGVDVDPPDYVAEAGTPYVDSEFPWYGEVLNAEQWNTWDGWYSLPSDDMTVADYFGTSFEVAFPGYYVVGGLNPLK